MFYIKRNTKEFGPFNAEKVKVACTLGNILLSDLIRHENTQKYITVAQFIELNNIQIPFKLIVITCHLPDSKLKKLALLFKIKSIKHFANFKSWVWVIYLTNKQITN